MPSKTWSIMATGGPVIASFDLDSELCKLIKENSCGYCCPPDNVEALADVVLQSLSKHISETKEYGKNARRFVEKNCSKEKCCNAYIDFFYRTILE